MSFDPTSFDSWSAFLGSAFEECQDDLVHIFDAATVRELWLQGQLHIAARESNLPFLYVNNQPQGFEGYADLTYWSSHDAEPAAKLLMLGEVKFLGTNGYFNKNLDGYSDIKPFGREGCVINPDWISKRPPAGGLLWDYQKLLSYRSDVLKILLLVLDTRYDPDCLGEILLRLEFERPSRIVFETPEKGVLCRAWHIRGHSDDRPGRELDEP